MNALHVDLIRSITNLLWGAIGSTEPSFNKLLAVFVQEVEGVQVRASRDLDQLREAIPDLCGR